MTDIIDLIDNAISDTMSSDAMRRSEEHTSELQSPAELVDSIYRAIEWTITFDLSEVDPLIMSILFADG